MVPSQKTRLTRMSACRSDLADNGIEVDASAPRAVCDLARRNLEYFQCMLGYDAGLREVVGLIEQTRGSPRTRSPSGTRGRENPSA
jgi:hypothetical protein